jgi:hypothetical protein
MSNLPTYSLDILPMKDSNNIVWHTKYDTYTDRSIVGVIGQLYTNECEDGTAFWEIIEKTVNIFNKN